MVCESCNQQQATVHLTEIVNGQMSELHLCEACANQKGAQVESHFGLADLLVGLADVGKPQESERGEAVVKGCSNCGMTYDDFRKVGRLGCSDCYGTFKRGLSTLLKRIHGSTHHLGKMPASLVKPGSTTKSELAELKRQLERAIEMEEFEQAAHLRDQVRQIEREHHRQQPKKEAE